MRVVSIFLADMFSKKFMAMMSITVFEGVTAREGVPFPTMRHEIDRVTRKIYPDVKL